MESSRIMSMKYKIHYSVFAKQDVKEIKSYLAQFYPGTPQKFIEELKKCIEFIKNNPKLYEVYDNNPTYRKMVILDYIAFHQINESEKSVPLYRILHGKKDIMRYI